MDIIEQDRIFREENRKEDKPPSKSKTKRWCAAHNYHGLRLAIAYLEPVDALLAARDGFRDRIRGV